MDQHEDRKSQRQQRLIHRLTQLRHMTLDQIASDFNVTTQTARRDVAELDEQGYLRRVTGGAMALGGVGAGTLRDRRIAMGAEKDRIAAKVAAEVINGTSIFLDTGTTCEAIARALVSHNDLRIVTYSLNIAAYLAEHTRFILAMPGGFVRPGDGAVFGETTPAFLSQFRFDLAVVSVTGVEENGDLTDDDPAEVTIVRAAMTYARATLLAVDHSKFGHRGMVRMGGLSDAASLITDMHPPAAIEDAARRAGCRLIVAD